MEVCRKAHWEHAAVVSSLPRHDLDSDANSACWYLCAVTVIRNEGPYLDEWLAFCLMEGIGHVLIYDNRSTDDSRDVLRPWVEAGIVELFDWPVHWKSGSQTKAFADALRRLRGRTKWAAFIDPDEYLFSPTGRALPEVLSEYEDHAGVVVNWQCYGTSGHRIRPVGLTIESYTRRAKTKWARNHRVKTIVDPQLATEPVGSHLFRVKRGASLVTEDLKPVRIVRGVPGRKRLRHLAAWLPYLPFDPYSRIEPSPKQVSLSHLRINHYATRSRAELELKYKDRNTMSQRDRRTHGRYHDRNEVDDPVLASRASRVREIIDSIRGGGDPRLIRKR